ncbi:Ig-like domain-containing protein [Shewanella sp. Isolate11]|uniref:Ig-like domain-containing protein n=1 Tax=Shewanella sp. Isolate11 TaxID=2908530 RepID=UPI001EFC9EA3|nr:Ig-like domain-containing protein [Shewanella sp. Isolate11]MCG9695387.1 Ig-like domain-containing protein [Shewanella sp. Isolate11]
MLKRLKRIGVLSVVLGIITACGGDGSDEVKPIVKLSQNLSFTQPTSVDKTFGDADFTNTLQGVVGSGAISYSSSNPDVATVSTEGVVTLISAGSSQISANVAEDANYLSASVSYQLNVAKAERDLSFATGIMTKTYGDADFSNVLLGRLGSGTVSYSSSNPDVATISSEGLVTIMAAGTSSISVDITEDANFLSGLATYQLEVAKGDRQLAFDNTGTVALFVDQTYLNAINLAVDEVTFSSQDQTVASVDVSGLVTAHASGESEIFADMAETENYLASSSSFMVSVAPESMAINLLIGEADTSVTTDADTPLQLVRTTQADCDYTNLTSCVDGQVDELATTSLTDSVLTTTQGAYLSLQHGEHHGQTNFVSSQVAPGLSSTKLVSFDGYLWLVGGLSIPYNNKSVWRSRDGNVWQSVTDDVPFDDRSAVAAFVFNDQLWVMGTRSDRTINDLWRSSDGVNWTLVNRDMGFGDRNNYNVVPFEGKMWVFGGYDFTDSAYVKEIWSSTDGVSWTEEAADATATQRVSAAFVEFNGKLWQIGGRDDSGQLSDVWSSSDGVIWTQEIGDAGFEGRERHDVRVLDNQLVLLGGMISNVDPNRSSFPNDVWLSSDGINWTQANADAPFGVKTTVGYKARKFFATSVHQGTLIVFGGRSEDLGSVLNDGWQTRDAADWQPLTSQFPGLSFVKAVSNNQQLQLFSGNNQDGIEVHSLWHSKGGSSWSLDQSVALPFANGSDIIMFAGKLWAFHVSGIYSSLDGKTWSLETTATPYTWNQYSPFAVHQLKGELWTVNPLTGDIYSSVDGVNWTEESTNNYPQGNDAALVSFQDKLWAVAGNKSGNKLSEIWSSADGIDWSKAVDSSALGARAVNQLLVFDNKLWAFGGYDDSQPLKDLWSSEDGTTWVKVIDELPFADTQGYRVIVHDNKLIVMGGANTSGTPTHQVWISTDGSDWRLALRQELNF